MSVPFYPLPQRLNISGILRSIWSQGTGHIILFFSLFMNSHPVYQPYFFKTLNSSELLTPCSPKLMLGWHCLTAMVPGYGFLLMWLGIWTSLTIVCCRTIGIASFCFLICRWVIDGLSDICMLVRIFGFHFCCCCCCRCCDLSCLSGYKWTDDSIPPIISSVSFTPFFLIVCHPVFCWRSGVKRANA